MIKEDLYQKCLSYISIKDDVVHYKELKVMTPESIDMMWDIVGQLTAKHQSYYMLVDLSDTTPPTAMLRSLLKKRMVEHQQKLKFAAMYTQKNILINLSIKFLMGGKNMFPNAVFNTRAQAMTAIEKHKQLQQY